MPDRAKKDGYYENLLDALGYAIVNVSDYRGPRRKEPERVPALAPRKGIYEREEPGLVDEHSLDVKETRRSVWSPFRKRY